MSRYLPVRRTRSAASILSADDNSLVLIDTLSQPGSLPVTATLSSFHGSFTLVRYYLVSRFTRYFRHAPLLRVIPLIRYFLAMSDSLLRYDTCALRCTRFIRVSPILSIPTIHSTYSTQSRRAIHSTRTVLSIETVRSQIPILSVQATRSFLTMLSVWTTHL